MHLKKVLKLKELIFGLIVLGLLGCAPRYGNIKHIRQDKSNEMIEVSGFLIYEFENRNLYNSLEDAKEYSASDQCLSVSSKKEQKTFIETYNRRWVTVRGKYIEQLCGENSICPDSCSKDAVVVESLTSFSK